MVLLEGTGLVTQKLAVARNNMLCCGGNKEGSNGGGAVELAASPRRTGAGGSGRGRGQTNQRDAPQMVVQGDFRKVSGISNEIFQQIERVENDHDASTAAAMDVVERRGEMVVRLIEPRTLSRNGYDSARRYLALQTNKYSVQLVEIVKRPGQTLGLYIREGNGTDRSEGVFISRIALESPVYNSGCLRVGDEILAVNLVDVSRMGLDDVVIIMSIPRRLLLTTRSRRGARQPQHQPNRHEPKPPPVVVLKKEYEEDTLDDNSNGDHVRIGTMGRQMPSHGMIPSQERFSTLPRYRPPDMSGLRQDEASMYYNRGGPPRGPPPLPPHYGIKPGHPGGPPIGMGQHMPSQGYGTRGGRLPGPGGGRPYGMSPAPDHLYQPPPPVITEQPRARQPQHFYQYDRSYPKTLESLAERIHSFYGPPRPHGPSSMEHDLMSYGGTLGRSTAGRPRLARTLSDQRLPSTEREAMSDYEGSGGVSAARRYKAWQQASLAPLHQAYGSGEGATLDRYQEAMRRLSALRQRTRSVDYASDTEVLAPRPMVARPRSMSSRSNSLPRQKQQYQRPGSAAGDPISLRASLSRGGVRSSLGPSMKLSMSGRHSLGGSEDESDGAVSAPEMPSGPRHPRGRLPPPGFSSEEYRAWLPMAPSTSAIYDRIRQGGQSGASTPVRGKPGGIRFTYSADNLTDRSRDDLPYYARRLQIGGTGGRNSGVSSRQSAGLLSKGSLGTASLERGANRRLRGSLLEDVRTGGVSGAPNPSPTKGLPALSLLDINPAEFLKYKVGVGSIGGAAEGVSGILWVHLLAGRGLKAAGRQEFRDLYCVLECDRVHKARTVVRTGDHNFDWDETFDLDLINNKELDFLIYSWDPQFRHKLCYKGSVHLVSLLKEAPLHQLALKVEPRGTLYLKLSYTPPVTAFIRSPKLRKNAVFGVDLETVSQRESGGSAVPLVIARCVAEVERRGLDIIGLYRLCGSATKKRLLRDAFERNPRLVDLSADNVPDINVITGILKDYLRELPEPLFTKCLYQMLVDALTVMLPDDPEGNAKLMFSILDCLPKMNKITLFLLMDHLRLVSSQSERNKMTTQNLAICFGPVLMLQSEPEAAMDFHQPISILKFLLDLWPSKSVREVEAASARNAGLGPTLPRLPPTISPLMPSNTTKISGTPPLTQQLSSKISTSPKPNSPSVTGASGPPTRRKAPPPRGQLIKMGSGSGGGSGSSTPHSPPGSESDSSPNPPVSLRSKLPSYGINSGNASTGGTFVTAPNTNTYSSASSMQHQLGSHGSSPGIVGGVPLPGMVSLASAGASAPESSENTSGSMTSTPTSSITSPPATTKPDGRANEPFSTMGGNSNNPLLEGSGLENFNSSASSGMMDSMSNFRGRNAMLPPNSSSNSSSGGIFPSIGQHHIQNISTNPFLNGQHLLSDENGRQS